MLQAYLRGRRDTIRCIVASLTDDAQAGEAGAGESLFDELARPADAEARPKSALHARVHAILRHSAREISPHHVLQGLPLTIFSNVLIHIEAPV